MSDKIVVVQLKGMFQYILLFDQKVKSDSINKNTSFRKHISGKTHKIYEDKLEIVRRTVQFDSKIKIYEMHVWQFAYTQARKDKWQQMARDRTRFQEIINGKFHKLISPILQKKFENLKEKQKIGKGILSETSKRTNLEPSKCIKYQNV